MSIEAWIVWGAAMAIVGGIARLDWTYRNRMLDRIDELENRIDVGLGQAREALCSYKLEVAKSYATTGYLKDVDTRLTERLIHIENTVNAGKPVAR